MIFFLTALSCPNGQTAYRPTVYKTGVHTNFVDIDLFYPLLILHAKNVKLQWKFAKFLSNQFVLQLPFFFVITYNFAFLRSYSRYMVSNRYLYYHFSRKFFDHLFISVLMLSKSLIQTWYQDFRIFNCQYKRYFCISALAYKKRSNQKSSVRESSK